MCAGVRFSGGGGGGLDAYALENVFITIAAWGLFAYAMENVFMSIAALIGCARARLCVYARDRL